tara:strand:+ start:332 stop:493 length:162 start_codon:yes stop_codon:yes gene_type:complete
MKHIFLSFTTGLMFGAIFAFLKLPIPAPNTLAGVLGIVGIFMGYMAVQHFFDF